MSSRRARSIQLRAALVVVAMWAALSVVRLSRLVAPPEPPIGEVVRPFIPFARQVMPPDAAYVYVEPRPYGAETGVGPRLRYELYPRRYDDINALPAEDAVRRLVARDRARYIVVPDAEAYPSDYFLRQERPWFRRLPLDDRRYLLEVEAP